MIFELPSDIENHILSFLKARKYYKRKRCWAIKKNGKVCKKNTKAILCSYHQKELKQKSYLFYWHRITNCKE